MTILQPKMSRLKLAKLGVTRKRYAIESFSPFSIRVNGLYSDPKQINCFEQAFGPVNTIPSFAFIAAFPVLTQCLLQSNIPSRLMGLIHISTEFISHQDPNWLLPSDIEVEISDMSQTPKGLLYRIETRIYQQARLTVTNINTMLDKNRRYKSQREIGDNREELELGKAICSIAINTSTAIKYAKLSRDFNPIHLHPWLAKKFGLPKSLIHGMFNVHYLLSRLLSNSRLEGNKICVEFNRPCYLPNRVFIKQFGDRPEYGLFSRDNTERYLKASLEQAKE